ncbi:MAG TPA: exodeoxyribonuclease V subunit gamma [Rhabdochlamydiaceae bacterium]|jgi:exonuclease V gamma subunit|nr:exodeoxyribonuclease V subunit gamma [Rhabdochlamydiaceae bacterium]
MKIFVSNHLEVLAHHLKDELFQKAGHPFEKRWVIIPNDRVKQDLLLHWARDPSLNVVAGCKMIEWSQALARLFPFLPSPSQLSLKIEAALKSLQDADPLLAYLNHGGLQRKASLCDRMSGLFLHYLNQTEEKLLEWLTVPGWQQSLWRAVFGDELPWKTQNVLPGSVYLFHPFQVTSYQLAALKQMKTTCFLFSPCAMYWGDFHTAQEQSFLLKKTKDKKELIEFFENEHPLLAHWGKKGRQLLSMFEDEEWIEAYQEPGKTLLNTVQGEMLTLSILEKKTDDSIQIHSAPSKLREVEVVWEIIQRLPYKPSEILVLAPEMHSYAPVVDLVFRERGGPFDFAIFCLEAKAKSPLMQGLEALLELPRYRFSKESVEKLLFCPPFLKKFGFTIEEAHLLMKWIHEVNIRYDLHGDHAGSWKAGLVRLVEALVMTNRENRLSIDFSDSDVLSRWIAVFKLFEQISEDERSLQEWSETLKILAEQFFTSDPDDSLMNELDLFQQMEIEGKFPLSSIERILKTIFEQKSGAVQGSHLQAVRFASLEKGALIPAKAIILMGMEEGSFPRQDLPSSLPQLPVPSRTEEDQYLFLEAICSAREKLISTYVRIHPEDGKGQKASPAVEELAHYCGIPTIEHPFSAFDPSYYKQNGFRSFSEQHYEALQQKTSITSSTSLPSLALTTIDIRMLRSLARHPLKFFFEERMGIDFEWEESNTEFALSPLDMIRLKKASLKQPLGLLLQEMADEGRLPVGAFSKAAVQKIKEEIETYHKVLAKLEVRPEEIYSIELKASCNQPVQIADDQWIYPALHLNQTVIQGKVDDISPKGLLFYGDDVLADQLKAWPLLLIVAHLGLSHQLLMTKKGKISEIKPALDSLEKYLRYAEKALTMPSPLHPKWAKTILKEGKIPSEEDLIVDWAQKRNLLPPMDLWLKAWSSDLEEAFNGLF